MAGVLRLGGPCRAAAAAGPPGPPPEKPPLDGEPGRTNAAEAGCSRSIRTLHRPQEDVPEPLGARRGPSRRSGGPRPGASRVSEVAAGWCDTAAVPARRHTEERSRRRPLRPTTTVDPSCPATPSGSGRIQIRSATTRAVMTVAANARLARTTRWARRDRSTALGSVARSSRTTIASAVSRARSEPRRPIAIPRCAAAMAGASFTPSPTSITRWPCSCRARTCATLSAGSSPARTSVMPTSSASRRAARSLSPVSRIGVDPVEDGQRGDHRRRRRGAAGRPGPARRPARRRR